MTTAARRFEGSVAVVTGAGSGLGTAAAERLAAEGATVALLDRDLRAVAELADELPHATAHEVDVTDAAAVDTVIDTVAARHGRIDALVNNAGVVGPQVPVHETTDADGGRGDGIDPHPAGRVTPIPGLPTPADVAGVVAFLLSAEAAWITGLTVPVDGGYHAT